MVEKRLLVGRAQVPYKAVFFVMQSYPPQVQPTGLPPQKPEPAKQQDAHTFEQEE